MSTDLGRASRSRGRRPPAIVNRAVLAMLRSPLHSFVDRGLCELSYRGHRSRREVRLPVQYAVYDNQLVVLAGHAGSKRWWRHFSEPAAVAVRRGGRVRAGIARLVPPGDPAYEPALAAYRARHPAATGRLLLIETASGKTAA
jgi:hypothetical protein